MSFTTQVEAFIAKSEKNMTALIRQSVDDVIEEAQTPVAKGGKMRVKTGFLRASGSASLTGMPTGPQRGTSKEDNSYQYDESQTASVIAQFETGRKFYFGWTARYAKYRELYDGFLESALQKWPEIVAKNAKIIKQRTGR